MDLDHEVQSIGLDISAMIAIVGAEVDGLTPVLVELRNRLRRIEDAVSLHFGQPTVNQVATLAAFLWRVNREELVGDSRAPVILKARYGAMWVARKISGKTLNQIGAVFNDRDHSTVKNALARAETLRADDPQFRSLTDMLLTAFRDRKAERLRENEACLPL